LLGGALKSLQIGTAVINQDTQYSVDVAISSVDLSKSILLFSYRYNNGLYDINVCVGGNLTSPTNIHFERVSYSYGTIYIQWYVLELNGATVQRGQYYKDPDTTANINIAISSVDTSKTIVLPLSWRTSDGSGWRGLGMDISRAYLTSPTNLFIDPDRFATSPWYRIEWQIVTFN